MRSERAELRPFARALAGIALWQLASGLGNVLLGWPLLAAVAHTAGAAALVMVLTVLLTRAQQARRAAPVAAVPARLAAREPLRSIASSPCPTPPSTRPTPAFRCRRARASSMR